MQNLDETTTQAKLAIDPDMVGLASTYTGGREELAYWWGPPFDDDLSTLPVGVTVHGESDKTQRTAFGVSRTEFRWGSRKGEHIFEAEELRDAPTPDYSDKYGCRFVHTIVKEESGQIVHFDGSIRMYSEEEMIDRLDVHLDRAGRNTEYKKLWRCDGLIETSKWKRLLSDYYRDNYLIGEYLGAENPFSDSTPEIVETSALEQFVPYSINAGTGLRVAISYHALSEDDPPDAERWLVQMDNISDGTETHHFIEQHGIELVKAIQRLGASVHVPSNLTIVSYRDQYANLPLIYHHKSSLSTSIQQTIQAIKMLVDSWSARDLDMVLSYKVGFPVGKDREVFISFLGHVNDVSRWLNHTLSVPPSALEDLHQWAEDVSDYLDDEYPHGFFDTPPLLKTLMSSGVLLVERQFTPRDWQVTFHTDELGLKYEMRVSKEDEQLLEAALKAELQPALAMQLLASRCTGCDQSYFDCNCSKTLDQSVAQEITEVGSLQMFWTDRPLG